MKHKNLPRRARKLMSLDRCPSNAKPSLSHFAELNLPSPTWPSQRSRPRKIKLKCETPCCKPTNFLCSEGTEYSPEAQKQSASTKTSVGVTKHQSWRTIPTAWISPRANPRHKALPCPSGPNEQKTEQNESKNHPGIPQLKCICSKNREMRKNIRSKQMKGNIPP